MTGRPGKLHRERPGPDDVPEARDRRPSRLTDRDDGNDRVMPVVPEEAVGRSAVQLAREVLATMRRHSLGTHATALAFRVLV